MDRVSVGGPAQDEAARIGPVLGIVLDDLAADDAGENLVQGKGVGTSLLIRVIRDPDAVSPDGLDEIRDPQIGPGSQFSPSGSNPSRTSRF